MLKTAQRTGVLAMTAFILFIGMIAQSFARQNGTIIGKVRFSRQTEKAINRPDIKISAKGNIENVVITIAGVKGEFVCNAIIINQKNKAYTPRISATMAGNEITFLNSDAILHNVHTFNGKRTLFNVAMPKFKKEYKKKLKRKGLTVIKCDVHAEMIAYVVVTSNPYYAMTNAAGLFEITDIPAGTYTIKAWHEKLGTLEKEVTVKAGKKTAVIFELPAKVDVTHTGKSRHTSE